MLFQLDSRLREDSDRIGRLPLCDLRLAKDANYPWLILVPERAGLVEVYAMREADSVQLLREIRMVSLVLKKMVGADKINVATLGNVVAQLHVHVIARFESDVAWPKPVWGAVPAIERTSEETTVFIDQLRRMISDELR